MNQVLCNIRHHTVSSTRRASHNAPLVRCCGTSRICSPAAARGDQGVGIPPPRLPQDACNFVPILWCLPQQTQTQMGYSLPTLRALPARPATDGRGHRACACGFQLGVTHVLMWARLRNCVYIIGAPVLLGAHATLYAEAEGHRAAFPSGRCFGS